ncbi:DUF4384 domain-containing protein [Sorangium sp. So ce1128]
MERTRRDGCLSDLVLDRLLAEELDADASRSGKEHLAGCPRCQGRFDELERERARFRLARPPFPRRAARERRPSRWALWRPWAFPAVALGAAAALVLLLGPLGEPGAPPDETQIKGSIRLGFYVKRGDAVDRGRSGDVLHPGDAVRFTYTSRAPGHLAVVSRDGGGNVSVYHPDAAFAAPVAPGEDEPLPDSIVLDDVLGTEAIYAVLCREPRPVAGIVEQLRRDGDLRVVRGCAVDKLVVEKTADE